jgi:hypothetical protein
MNELQRQAYLSALGIENYAPRWVLPNGPVPVVCAIPEVALPQIEVTDPTLKIAELQLDDAHQNSLTAVLSRSIAEVGVQKAPSAIDAKAILQQLDEQKAKVVLPFSLTIYRPQPGFLLIDARDTRLALPTEILLNNLLRVYLKGGQFTLAEDVLRWPMIENRFVSRTEDDARNELQTWLAVENELRPIHTLWLMGENTARYWIARDRDWSACCWGMQPIEGLSLQAWIVPSLNQLLQNPLQKSTLWAHLPPQIPALTPSR